MIAGKEVGAREDTSWRKIDEPRDESGTTSEANPVRFSVKGSLG